MITSSTPYTISPGYITATRSSTISSGDATGYTYTWTNYDDTAVKNRLSLLESTVVDLTGVDVNFSYRISLLESHESNYATKQELSSLEGRVTTLETVPVGLDEETMDEILSD